MRRSAATAAALSALGLTLTGCATPPRTPFTAEQAAAASPEGFTTVRYAQDAPALTALLKTALRPDDNGDIQALALSGGGANGAYGAGLLHGWTTRGGRPTFQVVTGVSTGALAAPLAFLGPDWDEVLRKAYVGPTVARLLRPRGLLALFTPGVYRRQPLEDLVARYVTDDLIRAVATQHARGRRLLVATTNLDTEQLIVWDMGAIAIRGGPAARALFREVLVASASVPGVFAPSLIKVRSGDAPITEMHVDGQTESAFFAFPPALLLARGQPIPVSRLKFYIVVNGQTQSQFQVTAGGVLPVLGRSFDAASKASLRSVLISTAEFCHAHGCALRVSALPPQAKDDPMDFSLAHRRDLFATGEAAALNGHAWRDVTPP